MRRRPREAALNRSIDVLLIPGGKSVGQAGIAAPQPEANKDFNSIAK